MFQLFTVKENPEQIILVKLCQIYICWPSGEYIAFASPNKSNIYYVCPTWRSESYLFGARELDFSIYPWFALNSRFLAHLYNLYGGLIYIAKVL